MTKARNLLKMTTSIVDETFPKLKDKRQSSTPTYGQIIFASRMAHGYSQQELAKRADIDLITLSQVEGGYDDLSTEVYSKIFRALETEF